MSELKCCPFCGGEVEIALTGNKGEQWIVTRGLGKNKCTCRVFMESNMFSADDSDTKAKERDKLIAKWNTRTPMANIVEKLEERTEFLKDCTKYGNESAEQQEKSYSTMMMYEVADLVDDLIDIVKQEINNGLE
jgi:hypothetical protein